MPNSTNIIALSAPVAIQAAQAGGDKKAPARFESTFYTGGALSIGGWDLPVVVDLAGLTNGNVLVANLDHDASKRVGNFSVTNDGKSLVATGTATAHTAARDEVVNSAAAGYQWQSSLEVSPKTVDEIKAGETATANGQTFIGPVYITRTSVLKGFAFVSHGADDNTTATIAAQAANERKRLEMKPEIKAWATEMGVNVNSLTADQVATIEANYEGKAAPTAADSQKDLAMEGTNMTADSRRSILTADRTRRDAINAACSSFTGEHLKGEVEQLRIHALDSDMSANDLKLQLFNVYERESRMENIMANAPQGFGVVSGANSARTISSDTLTAAFLIRSGGEGIAAKEFGDQVTSQGRMLAKRSFVDICRMQIEASGRNCSSMSNSEIVTMAMAKDIHAAASTYSLPYALGNTMNRSLMQHYNEAPATWRGFCKVNSAADFKSQVGLRPSMIGQLEKIGAAGEVKHGSVNESAYAWSIDTYAKQFGATRKDLINDNLGFLNEVGPMFGRAAARGVSDLVWTTIMANAGSFFHADNANLISSGGSSALDATSLALGIRMMRQQRSAAPNYDDLDIQPIILAVAPENEQTAKALLNSEYIQKLATDSGPTGNTLKSALTLVVESRLSNTSKFSAGSTTAWFLFASPNDNPVTVGFLDGIQAPGVEFFGLSQDVNTLGVNWRVVFDYGSALGDPKAAVKSPGA